MPPAIRKDDLEALGDMAGLVGAYMQDFASKTDNESKTKLFKTVTNPKQTIIKALDSNINDPGQILLPENKPLPPILLPKTEVQPQPIQQPQPTLQTYSEKPKDSPQMEFSFIEEKIQGFGSVADVIKHFNERLDKLEEYIKFIKTFMVEIRANTSKKRNKTKNEFTQTRREINMATTE